MPERVLTGVISICRRFSKISHRFEDKMSGLSLLAIFYVLTVYIMTYITRFVFQTKSSITAPAPLTTKRIFKQVRLNATKSVLVVFESFSMTFVEVFRSDGTDTSISLQQRLAWSLISMSGLFVPYPYVSAYLRELWLLRFRYPSRACVHTTSLGLQYCDAGIRLPTDIFSCLIVPL